MRGKLSGIRSWACRNCDHLSRRLTEKQFLGILATFLGLMAGCCAFLLKTFIDTISRFVTGFFPTHHLNYLLLILPTIGIILCGIYCRYIVRDNLEHGTQKILHNLLKKNYDLKRHTAYAPMIAASLTLGFGGSAGSEGPIAYTGAGLGSNLGKYFKLSPENIRLLIIIGAGAGIAGIFKAPIGGMLFSLEVLGLEMTTISVIALVCSCLMSAAIACALSGFTIDISFLPKEPFEPSAIIPILILGIFCGIYSAYYSFFMQKTENLFDRVKNPWSKNLFSGALIGLLIFLFPVLFGEGYGVIGNIINGNDSTLLNDSLFYGIDSKWVLIIFLGGSLLVKSIATSATNSGGGVGGDFAPTLFAGCLAGLLFAYTSNTFFGTELSEANFALFGMAGVMAGAVQAPLMAIFLTAEMTGDFGMFIPLSLTAALSYWTLRFIHSGCHIDLRPSWVHNSVEKLIQDL